MFFHGFIIWILAGVIIQRIKFFDGLHYSIIHKEHLQFKVMPFGLISALLTSIR